MSGYQIRRLLVEVKEWCKTHGMKQTDLAKELGISPQRLNDILTGRRNAEPTGAQVLKLQELIKRRRK
jgi:transcriptional regulator with XRE-family HTH domain